MPQGQLLHIYQYLYTYTSQLLLKNANIAAHITQENKKHGISH